MWKMKSSQSINLENESGFDICLLIIMIFEFLTSDEKHKENKLAATIHSRVITYWATKSHRWSNS